MDISKGIKLGFKKSNKPIRSDLEMYDSTNRIPFSLKIDYSGNRPTSIYCEISEGENFIELWFDKQTKKLYEVTMVSIQENAIELKADDVIRLDEFHECYIENDSELNMSKSIKILRSEKSLCFSWGEQVSKIYCIAEKCILGVDGANKLCSISLVDLSKESICQMIGF